MEKSKIKAFIYNFKTQSKYGFVGDEREELLKHFPAINREKFNNALMGCTGMMDEGGRFIAYHCDIYKAVICGIENRNLTWYEMD